MIPALFIIINLMDDNNLVSKRKSSGDPPAAFSPGKWCGRDKEKKKNGGLPKPTFSYRSLFLWDPSGSHNFFMFYL